MMKLGAWQTRTKESRLRILFWIFGVLAATAQAIEYRQWINADTISYLDMSDGISGHDWSRLINGHWSPLYPALIGLTTRLLHPSPNWEFPVVHLVNLLCFLFAFAAFEFFFRSLPFAAAGGRAFIAIAYSFFLWGSVCMATLMRSHPDLLMSAFVYLAAGILVRMQNGTLSWLSYASLGAILGCGFLAKAAMFPLSILIVVTTLFFGGGLSRRFKGAIVAGLCFAAVVGPYVVALSRHSHRPTFGDSGTWNYLFMVDLLDPSFEYQNLGAATGSFVHPVKRIADGDPPAFSFARPLKATYAMWYEPSYWIEGVRPTFQWRQQAKVLQRSIWAYAQILLSFAAVILAAPILWRAARTRRPLLYVPSCWPLYLLSAAALAMYAVLIVQERYIGVFIALIGTGLAYGVTVSRPLSPRASRALTALVLLSIAGSAGYHVLRDYRENLSKTRLNDAGASVALHKLGIASEQPVASITPYVGIGWARLARVQVVAEVPRSLADRFWKATPERRSSVLSAFAGVPCKAVVGWIGSREVPPGWQRLADSPYAVYLLP
jgi:hypothetical protein